jgi:hypothetical protein
MASCSSCENGVFGMFALAFAWQQVVSKRTKAALAAAGPAALNWEAGECKVEPLRGPQTSAFDRSIAHGRTPRTVGGHGSRWISVLESDEEMSFLLCHHARIDHANPRRLRGQGSIRVSPMRSHGRIVC